MDKKDENEMKQKKWKKNQTNKQHAIIFSRILTSF